MVPLILEQESLISLTDGCLVVEVHDYRPPTNHHMDELDKRRLGTNCFAKRPFRGARSALNGVGLGPTANARMINGIQDDPSNSNVRGGSPAPACIRNRIIMRPDSESLYETLLSMHQSWNRSASSANHPPLEWDDNSILELEARILAAIAPPLSLDTSILSARVANLSATLTAPSLPHVKADGGFIGRAARREWTYGSVVHDQDSEEDEVHEQTAVNAPVVASVPDTSAATASSVTSNAPSHLGLSKRDYALLLHGTSHSPGPLPYVNYPHGKNPKKRPSPASFGNIPASSSTRRPIDESFFIARQARMRVERARPMNAAAAAAAAAAASPSNPPANTSTPTNGDVYMKEPGNRMTPNHSGNMHNNKPSEEPRPGPPPAPAAGSTAPAPRRPKPKKKKKTTDDSTVTTANASTAPEVEIIDVDGTEPATNSTTTAGKPSRPRPSTTGPAAVSGSTGKRQGHDEMGVEGDGSAGSPITIDGGPSGGGGAAAGKTKLKKLSKKGVPHAAQTQQQPAKPEESSEPASKRVKPSPLTGQAKLQPHPGVGAPLAARIVPQQQQQGSNNAFAHLQNRFQSQPQHPQPALPNGISEDDFLAAAEAFGAANLTLDPLAGSGGGGQPLQPQQAQTSGGVPVNTPLQYQPPQQQGGQAARAPGGGGSRAPMG